MRYRLALLIAVAPLLLAQFAGTPARPRAVRPSPDPETAMYVRKGCGACHAFTGVRDATGRLGPDLTKVSSRLRPDEIRTILDDPERFRPGTTMPDLDLAPREVDLLIRFLTRPRRPRGFAPVSAPTRGR